MKVAPLQSFGIGDIIYCQTLANDWIAQGHEVIWGTEPHFVEGLNRAYPKVKFVDKATLPIDYNRQDEHDSNGYRVVPLRWSVEICNVPYKDCMKSKYGMFEQDWQRWREWAMWERDELAENRLADVLGIDFNEPYVLANRFFGTNSQLKVLLSGLFHNELPIHDMCSLTGYSLFDWAKVIENATEIHTVSTSIIYLLEMLDLKASEVHLYNRTIKGQGFDNIDYLLTRHKYVFHD